MTWKSYAAASGATVLAGWLASAPPANVPENRVPAPSGSSRPAGSAGTSDIEEQATRLQARVRREAQFARPQRNLFQFGAERSAEVSIEAVPQSDPPVAADAPVPALPQLTLAGVAEDRLESGAQRTAILSSPAGVQLVREGDELLGQYRVVTIEGEAVELMSLTDGSVIRLSLAGTVAR